MWAQQVEEREVDLCRDRAQRHRLRERVFPKITHQATPRAFAIGKKNRGDGGCRTRLRALLLDEEGERARGIDGITGRALRENPLIGGGRVSRRGTEELHTAEVSQRL